MIQIISSENKGIMSMEFGTMSTLDERCKLLQKPCICDQVIGSSVPILLLKEKEKEIGK